MTGCSRTAHRQRGGISILQGSIAFHHQRTAGGDIAVHRQVTLHRQRAAVGQRAERGIRFNGQLTAVLQSTLTGKSTDGTAAGDERTGAVNRGAGGIQRAHIQRAGIGHRGIGCNGQSTVHRHRAAVIQRGGIQHAHIAAHRQLLIGIHRQLAGVGQNGISCGAHTIVVDGQRTGVHRQGSRIQRAALKGVIRRAARGGYHHGFRGRHTVRLDSDRAFTVAVELTDGVRTGPLAAAGGVCIRPCGVIQRRGVRIRGHPAFSRTGGGNEHLSTAGAGLHQLILVLKAVICQRHDGFVVDEQRAKVCLAVRDVGQQSGITGAQRLQQGITCQHIQAQRTARGESIQRVQRQHRRIRPVLQVGHTQRGQIQLQGGIRSHLQRAEVRLGRQSQVTGQHLQHTRTGHLPQSRAGGGIARKLRGTIGGQRAGQGKGAVQLSCGTLSHRQRGSGNIAVHLQRSRSGHRSIIQHNVNDVGRVAGLIDPGVHHTAAGKHHRSSGRRTGLERTGPTGDITGESIRLSTTLVRAAHNITAAGYLACKGYGGISPAIQDIESG